MKYIKLLVIIVSLSAFASGDHHDEHEHHDDHHKENNEHKDNHHDDHHDDHGHGHGHGHGEERVGEGKAISAVDEHDGFKLSAEATKRLKIRTRPYMGSFVGLSDSSYVTVRKERALYRLRNGFYKLIDEHDFKAEFKDGDEIVVSGVELLRISDIFSTDKSEYGHAH